MNTESSLRCEVVQDLLPLYHDGVVNPVTADAVEKHLEACESCAAEYRLLNSQLPAPESDTKSLFSAFASRMKKKRVRASICAAIAACALLAACLYVLTQVPLVPIPVSDMPVIRAYRYEMDGNEHFFLLYQRKFYTTPTSGKYIEESVENGADQTLLVKWRKPVISSTINERFHHDLLLTSFTEGPFDTLKFNDTVIWSEAENSNDPVPEYVYAFAEIVEEEGGVSYDLDLEQNTLRIHSQDGRVREWNLEGNLLYDSAQKAP